MRFDPYIQDPSNSQNYNRYTYALNNPLKYIDPSGYHHGPVAKPDDWSSSGNGALYLNTWFTNDFNHNPFGNYEQSHTYSYDNFTGTWSNGAGQQVSPLEVHANKTWSNEEFNNFVDENSTFYNFTAEYVDSNNGGVEYTNKMVDIYPSSFDLGGMEVVASQLSVLITLGVAQNAANGGGYYPEGSYSYDKTHIQYLPAEGIGLLGGWSNVRGNAKVYRGSDGKYYANVSATGYTPASTKGTVNFSGSVDVLSGNKVISSHSLHPFSGPSIIQSGRQDVGSAVFALPNVNSDVYLRFNVGYSYSEGVGYAVPIPGQGHYNIQIGFTIDAWTY